MSSEVGRGWSVPVLTVVGGECGKRVLCADLDIVVAKFVLSGCVEGGGVISALLDVRVG